MQMYTLTGLTTAIHRRLLSRFFMREGGRLYRQATRKQLPRRLSRPQSHSAYFVADHVTKKGDELCEGQPRPEQITPPQHCSKAIALGTRCYCSFDP